MIENGVKATTCSMIASIRGASSEDHRRPYDDIGTRRNRRARSMPRRDKSAQREMGHIRTLMEALTVERGHYVLHAFNGSTLKLEGLASKMTKKFVRFESYTFPPPLAELTERMEASVV
ncbi:hypothetical protein BU15DRAFT_67086 [Melanogaster broomeanus]|nr:hypothetical protein BU15DRAFT_67086 [Melanogaster broomeanus]